MSFEISEEEIKAVIGNLDKINDAGLDLLLFYLGYRTHNSIGDAALGPIGLRLARAPGLPSNIAGLAMLSILGIKSIGAAPPDLIKLIEEDPLAVTRPYAIFQSVMQHIVETIRPLIGSGGSLFGEITYES